MNLISAPKVGKSWLASDLALCLATGRPWLGLYGVESGPVLIVDNELHAETTANRIPKVADARGIPAAEYLDRDDLLAIHSHGWRVAGEAAYPAIARIGSPGPDLRAPTLQDLSWLEGCLRALYQLFTYHLILDEQGEPNPVELTVPVETSVGILETRLRMPGMQV